MEGEKTNKKIVFLGTPEFAIPSLQDLINNYKVVAVITNPGDTPVKKFAEEKEILVFQPEKLEVKNWKLEIPYADLYVVVAYGKIIPKSIFNIPEFGTINVHASLLPRWRGSSPIQHVILNGDAKTGITIIKIIEKVDQGPILSKQEINIDSKETLLTLSEKLSKIGADLLIKTLGDYFTGKIKSAEQNELEASYTKILIKEDGRIIWSKTAEEIERQIRAFNPWPSSFTFFKRNDQLLRVKITGADIEKESEESKKFSPGQVILKERKDLIIKTGDGLLKIKEIQLEGGKILKTKEFLAGYPETVGQILT